MDSKLAKIGIGISVIYAVLFIFIFCNQILNLPNLPANEVGDFFAGVFGPLAILWLILGFFQQGLELSQNTKALELQAEELKASVEQQKELVTVTREQYESVVERQRKLDAKTRTSSLPKFLWSRGSLDKTESGIRYRVNLENKGLLATNVVFESDCSKVHINPSELKALDSETIERIEFVIENEIVSEFRDEASHLDTAIIVHYMSKYDEPCNKVFFLSLERIGSSTVTCHGLHDDNPFERDSEI